MYIYIYIYIMLTIMFIQFHLLYIIFDDFGLKLILKNIHDFVFDFLCSTFDHYHLRNFFFQNLHNYTILTSLQSR